MTLTKEQIIEFEQVSKPLVKFLNEHFHPHVAVIVGPTGAEITEGLAVVKIEEYLKD